VSTSGAATRTAAAAHRPRLPAVGTEVDDESLARAQAAGAPVVRAGRRTSRSRRGASTASSCAACSVHDEDRAFAEMARVLRPGGRLEAEYLGFGFGARDHLQGVDLGTVLRAAALKPPRGCRRAAPGSAASARPASATWAT
jgi:SAM-dependent methyltransferase